MVLLDSGASTSIVHAPVVHKLRKRTDEAEEWTTAAGTFFTTATCQVDFLLPELSHTRSVKLKVHVTDKSMGTYSMILGRDILTELGIDILFSSRMIRWEGAEVPMRPRDATVETSFFIDDQMIPLI